MAITLVQSRFGASVGSVASFNLAYSGAVTPGNTLIAGISNSTATLYSSVSDSVNGNWSQAINSNHFQNTSIWYLPSTLSGTPTLTVTMASGTNNIYITLMEWSGLSGSADQTGINHAAAQGTTSSATTSGTTTAATELVIGVNQNNGSDTYTAGSGFTLVSTPTTFQGCQYLVTVGTGTQTSTISWTANKTWEHVVATFFPVPASGPDTLLGQGWV